MEVIIIWVCLPLNAHIRGVALWWPLDLHFSREVPFLGIDSNLSLAMDPMCCV